MYWLLLGFTGEDGVQVGEDAVPAVVTTAGQPGLDRRPLVERFRRDHPGWRIRWDERSATPRTLTGPGIPLDQAAELIGEIAVLGAVDPRDLVPERTRMAGDRVGIRYRQHFRGAPVEGGFVDLVATGGVVTYVTARLHHVELDQDPLPGEVVLPRHLPAAPGRADPFGSAGKPAPAFVLVTREDDGVDVVYRDRGGREVHRWTRVMPLDVTWPLREPSGPLVTGPARGVTVSDGVSVEVTDDLGSTTLTGPLDVRLDGPLLTIFRDGVQVVALGVDDGVLEPGEDLDGSSAAVLPNFFGVRDWLAARDPTHPWLDVDVGVYVDENGTCNAFYTGGAISFFDEGDGCGDTAQMADVVYHEVGHGIHDYGLLAGIFAGDVSEGSADFVSATINDDPEVALGFFGPGTFLREVETDLVWPQDQSGDPHVTGLIWAGFWWDVRKELVDTLGYELGTETTDRLFLDTLKYGPAIDEFDAVLAADDDDGDPTNGTPNDCVLLTHGAVHGLAPDPLTLIRVVPEGPGDQPSGAPTDPPTAVPFRLDGAGAACAGVDLDGVRLHYAIDPTSSDLTQIAFTEVVPVWAGDHHVAEIPAQPAGTHVVYYVTWGDPSGSVELSSHGGRPDRLFEYWVGDQADLWCDDFEAGQGGWTTGGGALDGGAEAGGSELEWGAPPTERAFGATSASSGSNVLGQRLSDGLTYRPDNEQHASSPAIDLSGASRSLLVLSYRRWLSVGAAEDDRARVVVDGIGPVWQNDRGVPLLDGGWVEHRADLLALADADETRVHFTLSTDGDGAYDGWNVDDVCVRTLAEPERHYRAAGLVATDDLDQVEVSWTAPWVRPLVELKLVRKAGAVPVDHEDGELLLRDEAPAPGAQGSFADGRVLPGETFGYALFAADAAGRWYGAAVGENADLGGVPALPPPPEEPGEGGDGAGEEPGGCGCTSGGSAGLAWMVVAALLVRRLAEVGRRRSG